MYANDPLFLAVVIADRRADLQRAATPSRTTPKSRRQRVRRLIGAMQRKRPSLQPATIDEQVPLEAASTARPDPVIAQMSFDVDQETRDLDAVLV